MYNNKKTLQKEKKGIDIRALEKVLKIYILPLVSMALFFLVIIFLVIPKISEIFSSLDIISKENMSYEQAKVNLDELQSASQNTNTMLSQLDVVNQTTPTGKTEVVKFRDKITNLTTKNNLVILSQQLSENNLPTGENQQSTDGSLSLQEVPFTFEIQGQYSSLINFLKDLSSIDDFIIVREMELNSNAISTSVSGSDLWVLKLTINKYQFSQISQESQDNIYQNIPISAQPSQKVLDYVNSKIQ